jgi:UTP--glucose-1-phosphate uridylyltransferase
MSVMQNQSPVRKAVIAAAGFGTRFLPQTKAMPKEMLPIVDKPIIQYIVEELVAAGIEDIVLVTGYHKRTIEDHFDQISTDLKANLQQGQKEKLLDDINRITNLANFVYIRQKGPYGNATPVLNAEHLIGNEPFIYAFADDIFVGQPSRFQQMIDTYKQYQAGVLACLKIETDEQFARYGVVSGQEVAPGILQMNKIVEKPGKQNAPSNLASLGGYLLTPDIFTYIRESRQNLQPGKEFYIQDAMQMLIDRGGKLLAQEIKDNRYYDTGNKLEYLKTVVDFGLKHDDINADFREYLRTLAL